ncbi:MAG: CRISPR-associated CARF protein Csx1 [Candidatus Methanomethylicia archaeon]
MKSILVATWGNPWIPGWSSVEYVYGNNSIKSRSSLPLLLNSLSPDLTLIVVLDTVANKRFNSYNDLLRNVEYRYREFLKSLMDEARSDLACNVSFIVAPGVGRFKFDDYYFRFSGSLSDFYAYTLYALLKYFLCNEELTVYLDLTHGINFMPTLTYRCIREMLNALALTTSVELKVFNSDPYVRNVTDKMEIHLVEDRVVSPLLAFQPMKIGGVHRLLSQFEQNDGIIEVIKRFSLNNHEVEELNVFLNSVLNGFPLALYRWYPDLKALKEKIDEAFNTWLNEVCIKHVGNEYVIERKVKFTEDFTTCTIIWFIASLLNLSRKHEVSFNELNELCERLFSKFKRLEIAISHDLCHEIPSRISKKIKEDEGIFNKWIRLNEVIEGGGFDNRNFIFHSGFERNTVEIRIDSDSEFQNRLNSMDDETIKKEIKPHLRFRYAEDNLRKVIKTCRRL